MYRSVRARCHASWSASRPPTPRWAGRTGFWPPPPAHALDSSVHGRQRSARLMSHAMLLESLDTGGVWSIARGLARSEETYKNQPGRDASKWMGEATGEEALAAQHFFLTTCIDQVDFMEGLVQPDCLRNRIRISASCRRNPALSVQAILYRGYLPRGEVDSARARRAACHRGTHRAGNSDLRRLACIAPPRLPRDASRAGLFPDL